MTDFSDKVGMKLFGRRAKIVDAYRKIFETEAGKLVLKDLMQEFNFGSTTFVEGDAHATAFQEGGRNAVNYIFAQLETQLDPEALREFMKEEDDA